MEGLNFSTKLKERDITIDDAPYKLVELTGREREQYIDAATKVLQKNSQGAPVGVSTHVGLHSRLICRCLRDSDNKHVSEAVVQAWPATLQQTLFDFCMELNGLGANAESDAKNS